MDLIKFYDKLERTGYTRKNLFGIGRYLFEPSDIEVVKNNEDIVAIKSINIIRPELEQGIWFDTKNNALSFAEEIKQNITSNFKNSIVHENILYQNINHTNNLLYLIDTSVSVLHIYQGFCFMQSNLYIKREE